MSTLYSADDTRTGNTSPTLSFFPSRPLLGAGPALSSAQGLPNRPVALMQRDTPTNLSDSDKLGGGVSPSVDSMYSPNDTHGMGVSGGVAKGARSKPLTTSFALPSPKANRDIVLLGNGSHDNRSRDNEDKDSVCSEPVRGRGFDTPPVTPTPSLPGGLSLQMPAHLRTQQGKKKKVTSLEDKKEEREGETDEIASGRSTPIITLPEVPKQRPQYASQFSPLQSVRPSLSASLPVTRLRGGDDVLSLKEQLKQLMREKANLEGQLESVIDECQSTLKERSQLQTKLAQAEVELSTIHTDLTNSLTAAGREAAEEEEGGSDLQTELNRLESTLSQKRSELASKSREIEKERKTVKDLSDELISARGLLKEKERELGEIQEQVRRHSSVLEEKDDAIEELKRQNLSLKGSLTSMESSKAWLKEQLESAIDTKAKLQEELRGVRASGLTQSIKMEGLQKESDLLKQQVADLQGSILRDKAKLVTELEAIEADVIDKEGTFELVQAEKEQLQEQLQLKSSQLDKIISNLADQKAANAHLMSELDDVNATNSSLESRLKTLEEENNKMTQQTEQFQRQLAVKEEEGKELKKSKSTLQQQLQSKELSTVSKDGEIQNLKDSIGILKHERDTLNESKKVLEEELSRRQETSERLESDFENSKNQLAQLESQLQAEKRKRQLLESEVSDFESQLAEKQEELEEKEKSVTALQSQSEDIRQHFNSLQNRFEEIENESGASLEEKDKLIETLKSDRKKALDQARALSESERGMREEVARLKEENANLQGQLDSAVSSGPQLEDFKQVLKEKNTLDSQLASERLNHQQEGIKLQAKVARLETELKDVRKEGKKKEREFEKKQESLDLIIDDLQKQLEETKKKDLASQPSTDEVDGLHEAIEERNNMIETLGKDKTKLQEENTSLRERLRESDTRLMELEQEMEDALQQLKEEGEIERERFEEEKQQLVIEAQHLKGRLSGINRSQQVMREHTTGLEKSLAFKESQIQKLTGENNRAIAEKTNEIESLKTSVTELQDRESSLKSELQQALNSALLESQRADGMARDLERLKEELERTRGASSSDKELRELRESVANLEQVKTDLQGEVRILKQQLSLSEDNVESIQRELDEKEQLISILGQDLKMTKEELDQSQNEMSTLQSLLHEKKSPQRTLTSSTPHFIDGGLSPVVKGTGLDEKQSGEISSLKSQLGAKSKTLKNLHSCLRDLKNDMGDIQTRMDHHTSSLQNSYRSSQQLEEKIRSLQLSRSNSSHSTRSITPSN
ncbi:PREDICTED: golgin subfamily A member 3-like [Amphimedon queenslandica]|uniref:Uncharacterized protein n=1 Tax=Amphimedon queenslandica TaxID=400682 RepID=A0AAN0IAS7_AMPQE|nr:PREDICTED: golgin subfamily A member 3-like [Amphimedon queenslandica]|eukprot:XP_003384195.2 PREDICTED: golgin subfamily A member 3-like [Amphimedon queenslandica]